MKKTLVLLLAFLPMIRLSAQISEVEEVLVSTSNDFIHYSSVVRNYNDTINILAQALKQTFSISRIQTSLLVW